MGYQRRVHGDWEAALPWAANRVVMRSLQLVLLGLGCILGEPDVFENYFDDELRFVDVPQEVVLKACLANGDDTVKKIQKAYDKCFGKDYSFDDLADTVGRDSDNDDLPDEYEANEGCFYKTMDWVKGNQVQPSVIEADMAGLPGFDSFKDDINSCSAWSGNFGGRKKRDLGSEDEELEEVPSVMESGNGPLQWVRSLVRNVRSAEAGQGDKKGKKGKGKGKGKKGKGRKADKGKGDKKGKKNGNKKNGARKGGKKGKGKGGNTKKGNGKKTRKDDKEGKNGKNNKKQGNRKNKGKGNEKKKNDKKSSKEKGRSGKDSKLLPDFLYNQLWCFDLAMEQALERCVEDKLQ